VVDVEDVVEIGGVVNVGRCHGFWGCSGSWGSSGCSGILGKLEVIYRQESNLAILSSPVKNNNVRLLFRRTATV
jgi:hypothetical protein